MYFFTVFFSLMILSLTLYFFLEKEGKYFSRGKIQKDKNYSKRKAPFSEIKEKIFENNNCKLMELNDSAKRVNEKYNEQIICGRTQEIIRDENNSLKEILLLIEMMHFFKNHSLPLLSRKFSITEKTEFYRENFFKKMKIINPEILKKGDSVCVAIDGEMSEIMKVKRYDIFRLYKTKYFRKKQSKNRL